MKLQELKELMLHRVEQGCHHSQLTPEFTLGLIDIIEMLRELAGKDVSKLYVDLIIRRTFEAVQNAKAKMG